MTVRDLHEMLENLIEDGHADDRILLATQPSWPLAFEIGDARPSSDLDDGEDDEPAAPANPDAPAIVWLTEAGHPSDLSPYAPSAAWR